MATELTLALPKPAPLNGQARRIIARKDNGAVPRHLWPGLLLLLQAHDYAEETGRDRSDFAVEVADLRRRGMTNADCRWLVCKGWAQLARELKPRPGGTRRFQRDVGLAMHRHTCLVLTLAGERMARRLAPCTNGDSRTDNLEPSHTESVSRIVPRWDRNRHELRLGSRLIKQFKLPSPNQETILMALEEENWPPRIDDPLPPSKKVDAKQRLHDTIKGLNRKQKYRLLRFMGDGTGQGVRWELIVEEPTTAVPAADTFQNGRLPHRRKRRRTLRIPSSGMSS